MTTSFCFPEYPSHIGKVLTRLVQGLSEVGRLAFVLSGSLATSEYDDFSDIDVRIITDCVSNQACIHRHSEKVSKLLCSCGRLLSKFDGVHVNAPNLKIFYLEVTNWIVKTDVEFLGNADVHTVERNERIVFDNGDLLNQSKTGSTIVQDCVEFDLVAITPKMIGWLWYVYSKIARGELLQAANSLDYLRKHGVLPLVEECYGVRLSDYRRIEFLIPAKVYNGLVRSHPRSIDRVELMRALRSLIKFISETLSFQEPEFRRMAEIVQHRSRLDI